MRSLLATALLALLLGTAEGAANPKDCLDMSVSQDQDVSSPSGIRVTVTGRNHCGENVDSSQAWFTVKAIDRGGKVIGSQSGRFGPSLSPGSSTETKVFVVCDPDKVGSVTGG
jgi:hypothetical protein